MDEDIIRRFKRTPIYHDKVRSISEDYHRQILEETKKFVDISRNAPVLVNEELWQKRIALMRSLLDDSQFEKPRPTQEACIQELEQKANSEISSPLFWRNQSLRENYVKSHLSECYSSKLLEWEKEKAKFETDRDITRQIGQNMIQYDIDFILTGEETYIINAIDTLLEELRLPVNFMVDYSLSSPDSLDVDLDLPEIEDISIKSSKVLKSGEMSVKEKTQKEIRQDYAKCVCGLAFFISGNLFNVSPKISTIIISGYTQRLIKKTGHTDDEYLFSIKIDRLGYSKINFALADPIEAVSNFENVMEIDSNFEMRSITPMQSAKASITETVSPTGAPADTLSDAEKIKAWGEVAESAQDDYNPILADVMKRATADTSRSDYIEIRSLCLKLSTRARYWYDTLENMPYPRNYARLRRRFLLHLEELELAGDSYAKSAQSIFDGDRISAMISMSVAKDHGNKAIECLRRWKENA